MPYPSGADFRYCRLVQDRIEPRDLTAAETDDIATLRDAQAILKRAMADLDRLHVVEFRVDFTTRDAFAELGWTVERIGEGIDEIRRQPEIEADRAECERDA